MKRNITLSLPESLLRKTKVIAASRETSISELIRKLLEAEVREESRYEQAKERQLKRLRVGIDLGTKGKIALAREDLHARR